MTALALLPALLSFFLMGAHLLRSWGLVAAICALAAACLLAVPRPWARVSAQVLLLLGALEWARTLVGLATLRVAQGGSWARMALILGAVALFTALSALALEAKPARRWFGGSQG